MAFVIPASGPAVVPVDGGGEFPVRRIWCVGRNYADHAIEMGHDPKREDPFFFMKPSDAVALDGATLPYPPRTSNLHFEVELVVAIGKGGRDISPATAETHLYGYAVGVDLTRRDLQNEAKKLGRPWEMGKAFDHSALLGSLTQAAGWRRREPAAIWLEVNGVERQHSDLAKMIWSVPEVVAHLSAYVELAPGDLIYTGTPAGVGALERGDVLLGHIDGLAELHIRIGSDRIGSDAEARQP